MLYAEGFDDENVRLVFIHSRFLRMDHYQRALSAMFLSMFLSVLAVVPVTVAADTQVASSAAAQITFTDVPADAWYATFVRDAAQSGIVSGYTDARGNPTGRFGPSDPVTLGQALKIAVQGAGYDVANYAAEPLSMTGAVSSAGASSASDSLLPGSGASLVPASG